MSVPFCLFAVLVLLSACPMGAWAARRPEGAVLVYGVCAAVAALLSATALTRLLVPSDEAAVVLPLGIPWLQAHFRLDGLSAFFLLVLNLAATAASVYGMGHGARAQEPGRVLPFYPLFLAGMNLVLLAGDAFTFLLSWESMSLASWALVMANHRSVEAQRAGFVYIVMAAFGTLALLLALGLMAGAEGAYSFEQLRGRETTEGLSVLVLILMLVGAGSKAGLAPLHVWLPLAHPAAPSHVSALMSGVMTKVAVYGLLRILVDLQGDVAWWWGALIMTLGGLTAVLGVLHALVETDLKRLLAYSTVENVGIVFIGIGLGMAFQANGMEAAAALAYTAALFHVLNHSWIKSLLFLGAGAVLHATDERRLDGLGGLIGRMPVTAFCFLVGSAAIASLPPLNAFASEWMTLQAILLSPDLPQWLLRFLVPAVGAMLVLAAALAAAVFVKAFGVTFLGRARSGAAAAAHETDRCASAAMIGLVTLCATAGLFPGLVVRLIDPATLLLSAAAPAAPLAPTDLLYIMPAGAERASYSGLLVFLFVAISAWGAAALIHRKASRATRRAPAWDCGFAVESPAFQYGAGSMAQPLRRVFCTMVFRARETVEMPPPGSVAPARFAVSMRDPAWDLLINPAGRALMFVADRLNGLQFLTIRRYLAMMFAGLIALLVLVALWR
ncbi:MAG: hydrogenase 4 subunit B [Alphaproteobacteria bacterium]